MVECRVEFDYDAQQDDELSIRPGDIIKQVQQQDGGWWQGELNGKRGVFPDNFVKIITKSETKKPTAKSTTKDSSKKDSNTTDDFKMAANHESDIPRSGHVRDLKNALTKQASLGSKKGGNKKKLPRVRAVHAYTAEEDDELSFEVGDIIEVTEKDDDNWWRGHLLTNKETTGAFPLRYVEQVDEDAEDGAVAAAAEPAVEIQPKKVKGVGLGDIFKNEPIKLRTAGSKKDEKTVVKPVQSPSEESVPLPPKPIKPRTSIIRETKEYAKVLFPYDAANEDELSLKEGEQILVVDKDIEDEGWWKGELNGKQGVFPNNFVELIETKPKRPPGGPPIKKTERPPAPDPKIEKTTTPKEERGPPLPGKKPDMPPPPLSKKPAAQRPHKDKDYKSSTDDLSADFDAVGSSEVLKPITANRPKGPAKKRPPSMDLLKRENGEEREEVDGDLPWLNSKDNNNDRTSSTKDIKAKEEHGSRRAPPQPRGPPLPPAPSKSESKSVSLKESPSPEFAPNNNKLVEELRTELRELRANSVSKEEHEKVKSEMQELREQLQLMRKQLENRLLSVMDEIDEEKKIRLNNQVELERIKKLAVSNFDSSSDA